MWQQDCAGITYNAMQGMPPLPGAFVLQAEHGIEEWVHSGLLMSPSIAQVLCNLTNLRQLTVVAKPEDDAYIVEPLPGLDTIPPTVSRLRLLRSLRLLGHEALRTLPAELFTLSR